MDRSRSQPLGGLVPRRRRLLPAVLVGCLLALVVTAAPATADGSPPAAPTNMAATYSGGTTHLSWTYSVSPGVTGHRVTCELDPYADVILNLGIVSSVGVRLPPGTWMCDVRAVVGELLSPLTAGSIVVTVSPPVVGLDSVTATAELEMAHLEWVGRIDGEVDRYRITSSPPGVDVWVDATTVEQSVDIAAPFGVPRAYLVSPYRSAHGFVAYPGLGAWSAPVTVLPVADAPTITETWVDADVLEVHWTPPADTGGAPILGYDVTWLSSEHDAYPQAELPPTARSLSTHFVPGANEYRLRIRARTANGLGFPATSEFLNPGGTPDPVERLFVSTVGGTTTFSWDTPGYVPAGHPAHRYRLELSGQATDAVTVYDTSLVVPSLSPGWYQVRVRMLDGDDEARWVSRHFAIGDPPCVSGFPDVTGPPFCTPVTWLTRSGIGSGFTDGTFKPAQAVSRQAMASFLYRASGSPRGATPTCTSAPFPDVPQGDQFCGYIDWLDDEGIAGGFGDGTFKPTQAVSRQAMAAFLVRASEEYAEAPCTVAPFPDVPVSSGFCSAITALAAAGVAGGYTDGTFRPTLAVSRGAMAAFLMRWHP